MKYIKTLFFISFLFLIQTIEAQNFLHRFSSIGEMYAKGQSMFFTAEDGIHGTELWVSDGTAEGTRLVKDIQPGYTGSNPTQLTAFNGLLYFSANNGTDGQELWKSDGTPEGTVMVKNINPVTGNTNTGSIPRLFVVFANDLYFMAEDGPGEADLWRTDGTEAGTVKVFETNYTDISALTVAGNFLYFVRNYGPMQIWKTDGSSGGTYQVYTDDFSDTRSLKEVNGKLFFVTASSNDQNIRLFVLDPSNDIVTMLKQYDSDKYGTISIDNFTNVNGTLFYSFKTNDNSGIYSDVLWKSDGSVIGTDTVRSFTYTYGTYGACMSDFICFKNILFFRGKFSNQYQFYESDGTFAGTKALYNIMLLSQEVHFTVADSMMYFTGYEFSTFKLMKSDGTTEGTKAYDAINDGITLTRNSFFSNGGRLYYVANDGTGLALWNDAKKPEIKVLSGVTNLFSNQTVTMHTTASNPIDNQVLSIRNTGMSDLCISRIQVSGCNFFAEMEYPIIPPNESRSLTISFYPTELGIIWSKLDIYNNDATESCFEVKLKGTAESLVDTSGLLGDDVALGTHTFSATANDTLFLSNRWIDENLPENNLVGEISILNQDPTGFNFTLVSGSGDNDNSSFSLINNELYSNKEFDFETQNTYVIRVRATSSEQNFENCLIIGINDVNEANNSLCASSFQPLDYALYDVAFVGDATIFAVGGEGAILKSVDAGTTWSRVNSGTLQSLYHIKFLNDTLGYILCSGSQLLKTEDKGNHWFPVYLESSSYRYYSDFFFINQNLGFIVGNEGKILKTTDGGHTWSNNNIGYDDFSSVYFVNSDTGFVCGLSNTLYKTGDGGNTWQRINMDSFGFSFDLNDITFTNEQTGYLLGDEGKVLKTTDCGQSWELLAQLWGGLVQEITFVDQNVGYVIGGWSCSTIFKTSDAGNTWNILETYIPGGLSGIAMNAGGTKGCIVGNASGFGSTSAPGRLVYRTLDSGGTWENRCTINGEYTNVGFQLYGDTLAFLIGEFGSLNKSYDKGLTWFPLNNIVTDYLREYHFLSPDTLYMVLNEKVTRTFDGGNSWNEAVTFKQYADYCFFDYDHVFCVQNGDVFKSVDAGLNWEKIYDGTDYFIRMEHYGNNVIVALGLHVILSSINGGQTWSRYESEEVDFLRTVFFKNDSIYIVGGDDGAILFTQDGGLNWIHLYTPVMSDIVYIRYYDDNNGVIVSSRQIYETNDGGMSWLPIHYSSAVIESVFQESDSDLYTVGTSGAFGHYSASIGPSSSGYLTGNSSACLDSWSNYSVTPLSVGEYNWEVTPSQEFHAKGNEISIHWTMPGIYQVKAIPVNGCGIGEEREMTVIIESFSEPIISGTNTVQPNAVNVPYSSSSEPGTLTQWQVCGEESITKLSENEIQVSWGNQSDGQITVLRTKPETGCRLVSSKSIQILEPGNTKEILSDLGILVYPNPFSTELIIRQTSGEENLLISLYDEKGNQLIKREFFRLTEGSINLNALTSGFYILKITKQHKTVSFKLLKE